MGLKKGQCNNLKGRPKGKANKVTTSTKDWIQNIINSSREQLEADMLKLEPVQRWQIAEKLLSYVVPKQQATTTKVEFEKLDDSQIDLIISNLKDTLK